MQWLSHNFIFLKRKNCVFKEVVHLVVIFFVTEFIDFVIVLLALFQCSCLESTLCTTFIVIAEHLFKSKLTCLSQFFQNFVFIILYHIHPVFIYYESIYFGASTNTCQGISSMPKSFVAPPHPPPPPHLHLAFRRSTGSWCCTTWIPHNRIPHNYVCFVEEYEEKNIFGVAFVLFGPTAIVHNGVSYTTDVLREINAAYHRWQICHLW